MDDNCNDDSLWCERNTRWHDWGRWVFLAFVIIGFFLLFAMCTVFSARRRRRTGTAPFFGTAWLAPKQSAQPGYCAGPPGPAGYYPPPPPQGQGEYYASPAPPYTANAPPTSAPPPPQENGYYAPPPGPPPAHAAAGGQPAGYELNQFPQHTGGSYQSNNPYIPPRSPPPAHVEGKQ